MLPFKNVPPPLLRGRPVLYPACCQNCVLPSPPADRLGHPNRLSAENLSKLQRSLYCGPLSCSLPLEGFLTPRSTPKISSRRRGLLLSSPAITQAELSSARFAQLFRTHLPAHVIKREPFEVKKGGTSAKRSLKPKKRHSRKLRILTAKSAPQACSLHLRHGALEACPWDIQLTMTVIGVTDVEAAEELIRNRWPSGVTL